MRRVTREQAQSIIINPFYAIQVGPQLVETHVPSMHDDEWITGNAALIQKIGAEQWLASLLDVLQGNTLHELVNPYHAINIDPMFAVEHPSVVSEEQWVQGNAMMLSQLGTEHWLQLLLNVLEGDYVTAGDVGMVTPLPGASRIRYHISKQRGTKRKKHKR